MSTDDSIQALREQFAQMAEQLARLQERTTDRDPQIEDQRPSTVFYPSDAEANRYPPIKPTDPLFLFKHDIPDEEIWEQFRSYPKNHAVGYEPPKIPSVIHSSPTQKAHDAQLRTIQKRIAHLTRPVDLFLHQVWSLEDREHLDAEEMVELCSTFAILIRDQLAAIGGRINTIRLDNLRSTQGAALKQDPLDLVDPHKFQEEIKSIKALTNAFKPRKHFPQQQKPAAQPDNNRANQQSSQRDRYQRNSNHSSQNNGSDRRSSFHRDNNRRRGHSQQRGRSSSTRRDRSPGSGAASLDS